MRKIHKVVMLPTEKASKLKDKDIFLVNNNYLRNNLEELPESAYAKVQKQHLYILSNDEIKEGDCVIPNDKDYQQVWKFKQAPRPLPYWGCKDNCKKIIASTDKEITPNSWIPESFIQAYIKAYNAGTPITEVSFEYELNCQIVAGKPTICKCILNHYKGDDCIYEKPKTRPDGSVIIHQSKVYTHDEHVQDIKRILGLYATIYSEGNIDKWIEENL